MSAEAPAEACDRNLGPRQRRRRLRLGIAASVVSAAIVAATFVAGASFVWRFAVLPFVLLAALGFLQYAAKT